MKSDEEHERTVTFKRNIELENLLKRINNSLINSEKVLIQENIKAQFPVIFLVGSIRSGTTLFMQWLASTGAFAYPTNFLSRFYNAPVLGVLIQKMIFDTKYNFRNELGDFSENIKFESENGKTKGFLAPNEFWYFWKRFFPDTSNNNNDFIENSILHDIPNKDELVKEIIALINESEKPFVFKSMLMNYNIEFLSSLVTDYIFIHLTRDHLQVIKSILAARKLQLGSIDKWFSNRIKEFDELKKLNPYEQVAGQVYYNLNAVNESFKKLESKNIVNIDYNEFCKNPESIYEIISQKIVTLGYSRLPDYNGAKSFTVSVGEIDPKIVDAANIYFK